MQPITHCCFQKIGAKVQQFTEICKFSGIELVLIGIFLMFKIDTPFACLK